MATRKGMGRKKIDIIKIQDETNRLVTFSKRRLGLFSKASKLSTVSGADIALILFSPAGRVHTFGHSSVDSVIHKFLGENDGDGDDVLKAYREVNACELNQELVMYQTLLEDEKKRAEMLAILGQENQSESWWMAPIEELDMEQLQDLKKKMEGLKDDIINQVHKGVIDQAASSSSFAAEKDSSPITLELTLGPSGYEDPDKPEGSKAREFHRFL